MWANPRPPSRTSPGDHFNNNSAASNPYSRSAAAPKAKPGRQSTDPWDWGWEDNSAQQDDWNNGWNHTPAPVPNVIPNPSPSLYHPSKPQKKTHGTPDLIPEKINNISRGNMMQMGQPQRYNQSNAKDFFENIDLVGQNHQAAPMPPMYNPSEIRGPQQPNLPQNYHMFQPMPPQSGVNRHPSTNSYFRHPQISANNETLYYQQPPPPHNPNMFQNSQYYQPEVNNQLPPERGGDYFDQNQFSALDPRRNYFDHNQSSTPEPGGSFYNQNQSSTTEPGGSFYNQNQSSTTEHSSYYDQNAFMNTSESSTRPATNPVEVENIEVAPPERSVTPSTHAEPSRIAATQNLYDSSQGNNSAVADETSIPDNQETVPDNEEHIQSLPQKLSQMKISAHNIDTWNNSPGWENQEVTPRCELDRNQYLETGQLVDSNEAEEVPLDTDNNDEGEALPPPGLHRMVTGQGTESISQRSVLGQPPSNSQSNSSGFVRLIPGQPTPSASPEPTSLERLVPGQQNNEDISTNPSLRMIPGHQSQSSQSMRFFADQEPQIELQRLVPGQTQNDPPIGVRMILGQLSDDENNISNSDLERMIPGGMSEHENSFTDVPDDERMVPGGMSDDSRSQSISIDDDTRNSSERMVPGMQMEMSPPQTDSQTERLVTGAGSADVMDPSLSMSSQDGARHVVGHRNGPNEPVSQPPPGLHRLVLGQINSEASTDTDHASAKTTERVEETPGGNPPPGMHRLVVGQFREKEPEAENDKEKEPVKSNDREDDSDSDYRSDRRRHRHRKDSFEDEKKERDYSSDREYRGKPRDERREYRKKRDNSYNRSPDFRSDHEEYDRNDFRDRRERDRRDRPRDRDRRRRSPDYNYDPYYRDDPRKLLPRERDRRYYEPYEDDPYYNRENRSRPSSRSGSEYRRHRDYPTRQPYYPEQGGGNNYMHYYQMQQFYENMRRNDPQGYALWYERYMAEKFGSASNDRASVHSGRSSANDNSQLQENEEEDREGIKADDTVSHRSTPPLYSSAHIRGHINMLGQLVVVNPHDPFSYGEHQATVTVCKVGGPNAADTLDTIEFLHNPGPFISGVTHKNTVLQYLKKQSDQFSHSSEKLLHELIRLVIKLNGVVDMTDVADLLIESYQRSNTETDYFPDTSPESDDLPPLSPHQITSRFRELLLEGNKTEALEWAMKNKDWGHALFLASKMDSRTHNNVMLRFANGLQNNDPLQTLYQLMSGREPQAATCASDKKWGDWRPHLAMMLSNRTANIELDRKAILTLGDSLGARGRLYASHFCYLTAQLEFSNYSDRQAKLVLLGASPDKPFPHFASCRAIMLTLCYEYAKQLSSRELCIPTLRPYKFILACRLFDHGNLSAALGYLEALAQEIVRLPTRDDKPLTQLIIDMADKIKCADSSLAFTTDPSNDPDWLAQLKFHVEETNDPNYMSTQLTRGISTSTMSDLEPINGGEHVVQPIVQDVNHIYSQEVTDYAPGPRTGGYVQEYYDPSQNSYYNPAQSLHSAQEVQQIPGYNIEKQPQENASVDYWGTNQSWDQQPVHAPVQGELPVESAPHPQISVKPGFGYFATSEENVTSQVENPSAPPVENHESKEKSSRRANKTQHSGSGWFGGIWDKLALRPKNQMKLPDDKNPPIVWDEKTKRWVNTDSTEEEQSVQLKPPPKASEVNGSVLSAPAPAVVAPGIVPTGLPPPGNTSTNMYKMQRGKGMRGNYVDVMGSNKKPASSSSNPTPFAAIPQAPLTNFFVPAPVPGNENAPVDFLSPSGPVSYEPSSAKSDDQPPPLSRSSSASSLSREVTFYMSRRQPSNHSRTGGYGKGNPAFFNPANYKS